MPEAYLECAMAQRLGEMRLQVAFSLRTPWTILFGPSGAGKTSLLRALAGLARPDTGRIVLAGRSLLDTATGVWVKPAARGIGFVSQRPALFPHMSVAENVAFSLAGVARPQRAERVAAMLTLLAVSGLATRRPAALSGGETQRVALARALVAGPRLLLLDEPFAGLDGGLKRSIVSALTGWLAARDIPVVLVTHDVGEAFMPGAEVVVMEQGRITAQGAAAVVLAAQRQELLDRLQGVVSRAKPAPVPG